MHYVRVIRRVTLKKEIFALEQINKRKKKGAGDTSGNMIHGV